ncbi:DUF365 domain-containing protein [Methanobacterium formicicum]|uniref:ASCH domain-containing protein n=1 Tax=Methanobacterium formicicum (strain DSM 3637 / PP1) TaxID=1204725 RepID=K2QFL5_METFP|nr:DUF365 domain-containing protein [Methanobacterium formicicum]EKF86841.1 hypothetical protein A994_01105 [Methanobacterium formicicum DSM 3637]
MDIVGVTHPVPTEYAKRIYNKGKTVFVGRRCLCRIHIGEKFVIYESQGAKAYTGWADIKFIGKMKPTNILRNYGTNLMLNQDELREYSKGRSEMSVIEFENFEKFSKPVKPDHFVTVAGKYIYEDEFGLIQRNKD